MQQETIKKMIEEARNRVRRSFLNNSESIDELSSESGLFLRMVFNVFPEARYLGEDIFDWADHKRNCEAIDRQNKKWRYPPRPDGHKHPQVQAWKAKWEKVNEYDPECGLAHSQWLDFKAGKPVQPVLEPLFRGQIFREWFKEQCMPPQKRPKHQPECLWPRTWENSCRCPG